MRDRDGGLLDLVLGGCLGSHTAGLSAAAMTEAQIAEHQYKQAAGMRAMTYEERLARNVVMMRPTGEC